MTETQNINRTGKVTISRKNQNSMRKDMARSIYRYLLLAIPLGILIAFLNPAITTLVDWSIAIASALFAALLFWIGGIMVNRGSMVESICFDYDNQVLKLKRTDFRNRQGRMEIPFENLGVTMRRGFFERRDRAYIYSKKKKMAVLVFSFGWEDSAYDKVADQIETYLADKIRYNRI